MTAKKMGNDRDGRYPLFYAKSSTPWCTAFDLWDYSRSPDYIHF